MKQLDRLEKILEEDGNSYSMEEIMRTLALSFEGYESRSKTVKSVKSKVTKGEWNSLVNGIMMSFLVSLHACRMTPEEAIGLADTEGIIGVGFAEVEDK